VTSRSNGAGATAAASTEEQRPLLVSRRKRASLQRRMQRKQRDLADDARCVHSASVYGTEGLRFES
jgi:hypothetical protein